MLNTTSINTHYRLQPAGFEMPVRTRPIAAFELTESDTREVLAFLRARPTHTVIMMSYIRDNGIVSPLHRGRFFGFRNVAGSLEGVALIGHSTLVEARTNDAIIAFAAEARRAETPIHLVMSDGNNAATFWVHMTGGLTEPRLTCTERLFEAAFPFMVPSNSHGLRNARPEELVQVAEAQAEVAFAESGVDPMVEDREGFLKRVARRIDQGRVFVVFDGDNLVFKADVIAETDHAAYLEGVYVGHEYRGKGIGHQCLASLTVELLARVSNVCLLSNVEFASAHRTFERAGYRSSSQCTTLFV